MVSICIFGSLARSSTDELSDKDVLVIGSDNEICRLKLGFRKAGWSVSGFLPHQFQGMVSDGSLFVQHLRQEGQIVYDPLRFLSSSISQFSPKPNYWPEILDAFKPLDWLETPDMYYWKSLFLADILFVCMRNAGIMYLASSNDYVFDFSAVIDRLGREFSLRASEVHSLKALRRMKSAYRSRQCAADLSEIGGAFHASKALADRISALVPGTVAQHFEPNGYHDLRKLEFRLIKCIDPRDLDTLPYHNAVSKLWNAICNPSLYPKPKELLLSSWEHVVSDCIQRLRAND